MKHLTAAVVTSLGLLSNAWALNSNKSWSPTHSQVIMQLSAELINAGVNDADKATAFAKENASRLKALGVTWDDYRTALYQNTPTDQLDLSNGTDLAKAFNQAATPARLVNFTLPANRSLDTINKKIYAVHSTKYLPQDKIELTPVTEDSREFRPTIHFALGGLVTKHHEYTWEDMPYAVLTPLANLGSQAINLMAQDTFIAGDFVLTADTIVLLPQGTDGRETKAKIKYYDSSQETLRQAIDRTLKELGAWRIVGLQNDTDSLPKAFVDGVNINDPTFFAPYLAAHPGLRFGNHPEAIVGGANYAGILDNVENSIGFTSYYQNTIPAQTLIAERASQALLAQIKNLPNKSAGALVANRFAKLKSNLEKTWRSGWVDAAAGGTPSNFDQLIGSYLCEFPDSVAVEILSHIPEGASSFSKSDFLTYTRLKRAMRDTRAKDPAEISAATQGPLLQALLKAKEPKRIVKNLVFEDSETNYEDSLQYWLAKNESGHRQLLKWLSIFNNAGLLNGPKRATPGVSCSGAQIIDNTTGIKIGGEFANADYCKQAVATATPELVCSINGNQRVSIFAHTGAALLVTDLEFFTVPLCSRLIGDVLKD